MQVLCFWSGHATFRYSHRAATDINYNKYIWYSLAGGFYFIAVVSGVVFYVITGSTWVLVSSMPLASMNDVHGCASWIVAVH